MTFVRPTDDAASDEFHKLAAKPVDGAADRGVLSSSSIPAGSTACWWEGTLNMWRTYLISMTLLAIIFTASECDKLVAGGSGSNAGGESSGTSRMVKSVDDAFGLSGSNRYFLNITLRGHTILSDGTKRSFDTLWASSRGEEVCIGTPIDEDWDHSGSGFSPLMMNGSGGYADDWWDCLWGQAVFGYGDWVWENQAPPVSDDGAIGRCYELIAPDDDITLCPPF